MKNYLYILILIMIQNSAGFGQKIITTEYDWSTETTYNDSIADHLKDSYIYLKNYIILEYNRNNENNFYIMQTQHYIVYLKDDHAVDMFNKVYIPFNNAIDIINVKARTYNKKGDIVNFDKKNIKDVENLEEQGKFKLFALDGVEKGNYVEVFYTIKKPANYYGGFALQKSVLSKDVLFQISTPENIFFSLRLVNGKGIFSDTIVNNRNFISYYFDSIPCLLDEKYSNYNASKTQIDYKFCYNSLINKAERYTYDKAAQDLYAAVFSEWDVSQKKALSIIKDLKINNLLIDEKILAIENFVKNNYSINDLSNEKNANKFEFVSKNKMGNELGVVKFFAYLLKAAGIEFQVGLTNSRKEGMVDSEYMSWIYLNNYLFYFPNTNKYLSPDNFSYRYPLFPSSFINNNVMLIKTIEVGDIISAMPEIQKIPENNSNENKTSILANVSFDQSLLNLNVVLKESFSGYSAMFIHPYYKLLDKDNQNKIIKEILKSISDDALIKNFSVSNFNTDIPPCKDPFTIDATLNISSLIEYAGNNIILNVGGIIGKQVQLYHDENRKLDIDVNFPHTLTREIVIKIPDGYRVKGLEKTVFNITEENMLFESNYKVDKDLVIVNIFEEYKHTNYSVKQYENFRRVINAAADFNNVVIIFEKINPN